MQVVGVTAGAPLYPVRPRCHTLAERDFGEHAMETPGIRRVGRGRGRLRDDGPSTFPVESGEAYETGESSGKVCLGRSNFQGDWTVLNDSTLIVHAPCRRMPM